MLLNIDDIKFLEEYYPRAGFDNETVNQYKLNLGGLPPILVQAEDKILIDGYHRLLAFRVEGRKEIEADLLQIPKDKIFAEAVKRNRDHGKQLSLEEKRKAARRMFNNGFSDLNEIAEFIAVSRRFVEKWTEKDREQLRNERKKQILELYLACLTQEEISEKLKISLGTVNKTLSDFRELLQTKTETPEGIQLYNVWNFQSCDSRYGLDYPGRIPGQIVENLLHYYTAPFDLVVDPMAGGGTTVDVCKAMYRRYRAYDIRPVREDIKQWDITQGYPKESKSCDFIFLDPPYWRLQKGNYDETSASEKGLNEWLNFMRKLAADSYRTVKVGGYTALLSEPFLDEKETGKFIDLTFKCLSFFEKVGFVEVQRVTVPLNSQVKSHHDVEYAQQKKIMLDLNRDLVIFRRE